MHKYRYYECQHIREGHEIAKYRYFECQHIREEHEIAKQIIKGVDRVELPLLLVTNII